MIILLPFSLPLYFSFALPLSVHSSSVSFCLPAFFTIIFSPSSRSDSFYLLSFFQNQLRDIIARRCAMRFPAKKSLLSPTPRVNADYFPLPGKSVRTDVQYVITKFSGMDSLPNFLIHGAPLRARFAREGAPLLIGIIFANKPMPINRSPGFTNALTRQQTRPFKKYIQS